MNNNRFSPHEIEAILKKHFSRKDTSNEGIDMKEKRYLERKVREAFNGIYNIRKDLYLRDSKPTITTEEVDKFINNVISGPLYTHHSLRRFDCLCGDLVHIHELYLNKYNVEVEGIKPFLKEYISKCINYFIKKVFYFQHRLNQLDELYDRVLNNEELMSQIRWHKVFEGRVETIRKMFKTRGIEMTEEHLKKFSDALLMMRIKRDSYKKLINKYETHIGEYQKRRQLFVYSSPFTNEKGTPITNDEEYIQDLTERQGDNDINDEEYDEMIIDHMEEVRDG